MKGNIITGVKTKMFELVYISFELSRPTSKAGRKILKSLNFSLSIREYFNSIDELSYSITWA